MCQGVSFCKEGLNRVFLEVAGALLLKILGFCASMLWEMGNWGWRENGADRNRRREGIASLAQEVTETKREPASWRNTG